MFETDRFPAPKVLAVDDEELVLFLLTDFLVELGCEVISAGSAAAALAILRGEQTFDVLITDVRMPEMSGLALADAARAMQPDLPVIFVSGYSPEFSGTHDRFNRHTALLTKPFTLAMLEARLRGVLARD